MTTSLTQAMAQHARPTAEKSLVQLLEAQARARPPSQQTRIKPRSRQTPFCFLIKPKIAPKEPK